MNLPMMEESDDDVDEMTLSRRDDEQSSQHYHDEPDQENNRSMMNSRIDKSDELDVDMMMDPNEPEQQPVYQIRPRLDEKFKPTSVKEVIHDVLFDQLSTKIYNSEDANEWSKGIADTIKNRVKDLKFKRYKYIVNVVLGEQKGAGLKMGTRCIWDAEADSYAYDNFINDTIFCVASVYAVYFY